MKRLFVVVASIFVAYSTSPSQPPSPQSEPPQPIGGYAAIYKNLVYPEEALEMFEGKVVIKAFIDSTGTVTETEVLQGFPDTGLDEAVIEAIRKTSWKPAKQGGYSLGVWVEIPLVVQITRAVLDKLEILASDDEPSQVPQVRFIPYDNPPVPVDGYRVIQKNIVYPQRAQKAGIQGTVVISAYVDTRGYVTDTIVLKGIPDSGLDEAAMEAVRKTKFTPAKQKGVAVGIWISIPVNFRLK